MESPDDVCLKHFAKPCLRPNQRPVVSAALSGGHFIAILATGGGKSLTYQIPYMMSAGITVVVSPLIALIDDQVLGLPDDVKKSTVVLAGDNSSILENIHASMNRYQRCLLFTGPEKLGSFLNQYRADYNVTRLVLDEAHCAAEWGNTFRDAYLKLPEYWSHLGRPQIQALTATASEGTLNDLMRMFPVDFAVIRSSVYRSNLHLSVIEHLAVEHRDKHLLMLIRNRVGPVVIYANSRSYVDRTASWLADCGLRVEGFHAGLAKDLRRDIQQRFINGETDILVATIAFGMGIDKPDVRHVFHVEPPSTLEDYQQQVGRAGRDGEPSWCVLFDTMNKRRHRQDALRSANDAEDTTNLDSYAVRLRHRRNAMENFLKSRSCRHGYLLRYSGEKRIPKKCGHCDNCCRR